MCACVYFTNPPQQKKNPPPLCALLMMFEIVKQMQRHASNLKNILWVGGVKRKVGDFELKFLEYLVEKQTEQLMDSS